MSYILDALRKAERERNPGQATEARMPTRQSLAQASQLRRYRPLLVAGLCLGLFAALLILLVLRHAAAPPEETAPVTPAVAAAEPAASVPAMTLDQVAGDAPSLATLDDVIDSGADAAEAEAPGSYAPTAKSAPQLSEEPPAALPAAPADTEDNVSPPPPTPTAVQRVQLDPAPQPQVSKLKDMPADYRAAFPTLSLDVHVYDAAPQKRFVMIGGHRYNESETLREGPRIVQIVADGVIFEFRGEQVLFTIAH
jgi:general secretion pathway protein B